MTVSDRPEEISPGNHDPLIPLSLSLNLNRLAENTPNGPLKDHYNLGAARYSSASLQMDHSGQGNMAWNQYDIASDDMTYQCDPTLGVPRSADCNLLEYTELGPSSDTLNIGPGTPKVLTSSKRAACYTF